MVFGMELSCFTVASTFEDAEIKKDMVQSIREWVTMDFLAAVKRKFA